MTDASVTSKDAPANKGLAKHPNEIQKPTSPFFNEGFKMNEEALDVIHADKVENEAALTNRVAQPRADNVEDPEEIPPPLSPPSGAIPIPPDEADVKEHELAGYRATALQGRHPDETAESFETRTKQAADAYEKEQKEAAAAHKKLMEGRAKQEEAAAKK